MMNSPLQSPSRRFSHSSSNPTGNALQNGSSNLTLSSSSTSNNVLYSDRFIPSRLSSNLEEAFDLLEASKEQSSSIISGSQTTPVHENQVILNNLIRTELLGQGQSLVDYTNTSRLQSETLNSPGRKESSLFKYRSHSTNNADAQLSSNLKEYPISTAAPGSPGGSSINRTLSSPKKPTRKISKTPYKVLDAPALQDDYYLNLVDWSHSNVLSVALGPSVYLWSACTSKVTKLCDFSEHDVITSISWALTGNHIAIGSNTGKIQIWDATTCKMTRELSGHDSRVGTLAWSTTLLASGSRDRNIMLQDIRIRNYCPSSSSSSSSSSTSSGNTTNSSTMSIGSPSRSHSVRSYSSIGLSNLRAESSTMMDAAASRSSIDSSNSTMSSYSSMLSAVPTTPTELRPVMSYPNTNSNIFSSTTTTTTSSSHGPSVVREFSAHKQEVCGLKWSFDEKMLASGGNDNKLYVWDAAQSSSSEPMCRFEDHTAAVKAVAWSPHQHGLVASGGGTADRHIRFWNACANVPLHKIDTGSQVCNLMWSKNVNEIVSTHGYSLNQVIVWKYPSMQKIATLTGHTLRVLYLAMSPDGQNIVTGAGDETLRFWNVFPGPKNKTGFRLGPSILLPSGAEIR